MEKNQKSSKSNGLCGKLYKAINPFRRNRRESGHNQQPASSNLLSTTPKPHPQKTHHVQPTKPVIHPHKPAAPVPINFDFSSHPVHASNMHTRNGHAGQVEPKPPGENDEDISRTESGVNKKFSEYIENVKNRMQNMSDVESESEVVNKYDENGKRSHLDDRVTGYIRDTRIKLRTTSSSLGTAHSFSYKGK